MRKRKTLAPVIIFLIGAGIFFYPAAANGIAIYRQTQMIRSYESRVAETPDQEGERLFEEAETYNENLAGDPVHDPFVFNSGYVLPDNYAKVLNLDPDGMMGYIEIPRIDVRIPIYHGTDDEVLSRGVGHIEGTSLPIGGAFRHSVLCAHRGLPSAELFSRLDELRKGDLFYIHILEEVHAYQVDQIDTVLPEEIAPYLNAVEGEDWITLMTCTPYGVNTHRLLVRGARTSYLPPQEILEMTEDPGAGQYWICLFLSFFLVLVLILILIVRRRKRYEE